jgi:PAS domain S-box-containing protein
MTAFGTDDLKRIAEVNPGVLNVYDLATRRNVYINRSVESLLGYTAEEIQALGPETISFLMHPEDQPRFAAHLARLASIPDDEVAVFEFRMRDRRGGWHWFSSRDAVFARDDSGAVRQLVGTAVEITGYKAIEAELRASEQRFRAAIDAVQGVLWTNTAEGEMRGEQRGWAALTGQRFEEYQGFGWARAVHPEDARPTIDAWLIAVHERRPFLFEHRVRRHDGVWRRFTIRAIPVLDAAGAIQEWVGVHTDVTTERLNEEALQASEELWRAVFERAAVGVAVSEPRLDGVFLQTNETLEDMLGYGRGELLGVSLHAVIHPDDRKANAEKVLAALEGRISTYAMEKRYLHRDGHAVWVKVMKALVRTPEGAPKFFIGSFADISERKRIEAELRNADRRKDEFLATLAHELRNPLAPMRNALRIVQRKSPDVPEVHWAREVIDRQVQAMSRLIDDLMDVSRINQGKVQLKREHVELAKVIQGAVETSRPLIEEMGHELAVSLPPGLVMVDADLTRLAQVLMNLLNNAAKYTERGGRIDLCVELADRDLVISVKDTGIGIPADKLGSIFEMFSQVDGALSRSQGGLGIGLSLAKRLVEMHGGLIEARSAGIGLGSEFVVRLPIVVPDGDPSPGAQGRAEVSPTSSLRVLVVDDNRDAAESTAVLLELMGNTVRTVHDGEAALAAAESFRPDVVLCDIGLPKLNGYDVARTLRESGRGRQMCLVALTGWGQEADKRQALEASFDHHLTKPVDPERIEALLSALRPPN